MKLVLNLTFAVLFLAGVAATSSMDENSVKPVFTPKEKIRIGLLQGLQRYQRQGIKSFCPRRLSPEEIVFGDEIVVKFVACGNASIEKYISKLDDNVELDNFEKNFVKFSGPFCEIFDDVFKCVGEISPVIDLCLREREKIFKNKIFALAPLIHQTICLRNGALLAAIIQHKDTKRCTNGALEMLLHIGLMELFHSASTELFGDQTVCQRFNDVLKQIYVNVGECSSGVLEGVRDMLGFFCEGTHCEHYVHDLQCY